MANYIFKKGETAYLKRNPLDEQLGEFIAEGNKTITDVMDDSPIADFGGFNPMIINVFKSVVKFIEWNNKNKK